MVGFMQNYEIRILKGNNGPITYAEPAWSDEAAVQDAKRLAREQDGSKSGGTMSVCSSATANRLCLGDLILGMEVCILP